MAIGRPYSLTPNVASKTVAIIATEGQTSFSPTGGYMIGEMAVYRNGVKLVQDRDFTANDGVTVTLVSGATADDVVSFQIFDAFNVDNTIRPNESAQTINGDLTITGTLTAAGISPGQWGKTAAGINTSVSVGIGTTRPDSIARVNNTAILNAGIVTAYEFYGDGSNLSNVAYAGTATVPGISTQLHSVFGTLKVSGITTLSATTDSTSTSTGALIVSGGVGIAKSLFVGGEVSVGGTVTYDDVTNVDSVGIITAGKGFRATTGGLIVTAGVSTFGADLVGKDGVQGIIVGTGLSVAGVVTATTFNGNLTGTPTLGTGVTVTSDGMELTGITTATQLSVGPGVLRESFHYDTSTAITGTYNHDVLSYGMIWYGTTNAAAAFTFNVRGNGSTTFNSLMKIGETTTMTIYSANNNTSYYMSDFTIDGSGPAVEEWAGGTAPSAATGSGIDVYSITIMKTGNATFAAFGNFTNFG